MGWFRVAYRLPAFVVVTAVLWLARRATSPWPFVAPELDRAWRRRVVGLWARLVGRLLGMRVHACGEAPAARFLVTNHLGYVDILLLAGVVPAVFVAKADVARWPFLGGAARAGGTIFLDRERKRAVLAANAAIDAALADGDRVVLFAEGTSSGGERVLPLRPSALAVPAARSLPVAYAAIAYRTRPGSPPAADAVCWWGAMTFPSHFLRLLALPGFDAFLRFGSTAVVEHDRKLLARRLHAGISAELAALT